MNVNLDLSLIIKDKYFIDGKGLDVIKGNENFAIGFAIDYDSLK